MAKSLAQPARRFGLRLGTKSLAGPGPVAGRGLTNNRSSGQDSEPIVPVRVSDSEPIVSPGPTRAQGGGEGGGSDGIPTTGSCAAATTTKRCDYGYNCASRQANSSLL